MQSERTSAAGSQVVSIGGGQKSPKSQGSSSVVPLEPQDARRTGSSPPGSRCSSARSHVSWHDGISDDDDDLQVVKEKLAKVIAQRNEVVVQRDEITTHRNNLARQVMQHAQTIEQQQQEIKNLHTRIFRLESERQELEGGTDQEKQTKKPSQISGQEEEEEKGQAAESANPTGMNPSAQASMQGAKFKCMSCQLGFNSKNILMKHRKTKEHKAAEKAFLEQKDAQREAKEAEEVVEECYWDLSCRICKIKFLDKETKMTHFAVKHDATADFQGASKEEQQRSVDAMSYFMTTYEEPEYAKTILFKCQYCSKQDLGHTPSQLHFLTHHSIMHECKNGCGLMLASNFMKFHEESNCDLEATMTLIRQIHDKYFFIEKLTKEKGKFLKEHERMTRLNELKAEEKKNRHH